MGKFCDSHKRCPINTKATCYFNTTCTHLFYKITNTLIFTNPIFCSWWPVVHLPQITILPSFSWLLLAYFFLSWCFHLVSGVFVKFKLMLCVCRFWCDMVVMLILFLWWLLRLLLLILVLFVVVVLELSMVSFWCQDWWCCCVMLWWPCVIVVVVVLLLCCCVVNVVVMVLWYEMVMWN